MMNIRGLKTVALFLAVLAAPQMIVAAEPSLAEKLGYKATDKLLIVNGDDVGMSHSANMATINSMEKGVMTSGTIMVPCPWFPEIAKYAKEYFLQNREIINANARKNYQKNKEKKLEYARLYREKKKQESELLYSSFGNLADEIEISEEELEQDYKF